MVKQSIGNIKGPKGDKGDPGSPGDKGDPGLNGDQGLRGLKGDKGDPGLKGDKGDKGQQGLRGFTGSKGIKGDQGLKGDKGDQGARGRTGDPGPQGDQGLKGDKGNAGSKGDKGDPGQIGPAGLTWQNVWNSAEDYVQDDAVFYSGSSWFAITDPPVGSAPSDSSPYWAPLALQGAKGDKGDQGDKGDRGDQGVPPSDADVNAKLEILTNSYMHGVRIVNGFGGDCNEVGDSVLWVNAAAATNDPDVGNGVLETWDQEGAPLRFQRFTAADQAVIRLRFSWAGNWNPWIDPSLSAFTIHSVTDLDNAPMGFSLAQHGAINHPITERPATVMVTSLPFGGFDAPYIFQTAIAEDNGQTFARFKYGPTWYPWNTADSLGNVWAPNPVTDLNDAPDGTVFLDSGDPAANSPLGGTMDGQVVTITKYVDFDNNPRTEWRIQTAFLANVDNAPALTFVREKWQGDWWEWSAQVASIDTSRIDALEARIATLEGNSSP